MEHSFFDAFHSYTVEEQQEQIKKALGATRGNLPHTWISPEDIAVDPIYFKNPKPKKQDSTSPPVNWKRTQRICIESDSDLAIKEINDALDAEIDCIHFFVSEEVNDLGIVPTTLKDSKRDFLFVFKEIPSKSILTQLSALENVELGIDFYGQYAQQAYWKASAEMSHENWFSFMKNTVGKGLFINASLYANAGANLVQQIAFALSHMNAYLSLMDEKSIAFPSKIHVQLALGSNYFFELAKLASFRSLAEIMIKEYSHTLELLITAEPLQRNKTTTDYNVNILRTTTEMMSAVLGGANRVMNHSYDLRFNQPNAFGDRIARNQLHLLKYESYFDELPNVMDGSYYLEALQEEMKEKAWALFLEIEQHGGWLTAIESNNIQSKIEKARQEEARQFGEGALVLVGTNKYTTASSLNAEIKTIVPRAAKKKAMFTPLETFYLS